MHYSAFVQLLARCEMINVLDVLSEDKALTKSEIMFFDDACDSRPRARFLRIKDCITFGLAETHLEDGHLVVKITELGKQVCKDLKNLAEPISVIESL